MAAVLQKRFRGRDCGKNTVEARSVSGTLHERRIKTLTAGSPGFQTLSADIKIQQDDETAQGGGERKSAAALLLLYSTFSRKDCSRSLFG